MALRCVILCEICRLDLFNLRSIFAVILQLSFDFGSSLMDEVMNSLGTSTSGGSEIAQISSQQVQAAERPTETKRQAEVATVPIVASNLASPDAESTSDTESDASDETTSSESTVSPDENCAADENINARNSPTVTSPAVM